MANASQERIATLLATGLTDAQVASIVGLSPSRLSQLRQEPDFQLLLSAKTAEAEAKDIEEIALSAKYKAAEYALLDQVTQLSAVSELRDVTNALRVVAERQDRAKLRANPILQNTPVINNIVQLSLPSHAVPEVTLSKEREVIAIGTRDLTPLSSAGVIGLFKGLSHEQTSLPGSTEENIGEALPRLAAS